MKLVPCTKNAPLFQQMNMAITHFDFMNLSCFEMRIQIVKENILHVETGASICVCRGIPVAPMKLSYLYRLGNIVVSPRYHHSISL